MATTISSSTEFSEKVLLTKVLLIAGILSSLVYVIMNIVVPTQYEGYNSVTQTISELSAVDAPTRPLWVWLGVVYTLLVTAFGWGMIRSSSQNRPLRIAGVLMVIYGIIGILWPLAPMHQREVLATGGGTLTDTLHLVLAMVSALFMTVAMGFGATAFSTRFRIYSIATILILFVFALLTSVDAPKVEANLPTPWLGVVERIMIGVFLVWVVVLAIILLKKTSPLSTKRRAEMISTLSRGS